MDKQSEILTLTETLKMYQDSYYKEGISLVPDSEYDRLFDKLLKLENEYPEFAQFDSPTRRVGSDLTNEFPEVEHTIPVLSLNKAYSKEEVLSFFDKSIRKANGELSFIAEEKIDGISMVLYYEDGILARGVTRGNGSIGNDVTPNIITIKTVPLKLKEKVSLAVRGEVFISKEDFRKINERVEKSEEKNANARNLASGTVRRLKSEEAASIPLDIFVYEGFWENKDEEPKDHLGILRKLKDLGFKINPHLGVFSSSKEESEAMLKEAGLDGTPYSFSSLQEYLDYKSEERGKLKYEIDGLVFKINQLDVREGFGYTEHHPRWAIAYKFDSPQAESKLLGITCQVGRTGRITPVAEIVPTKLNGSTIKRATLHNQEYIDELELAIGDTVSISKRGDVIPAVEEVIEKNTEGNTTYQIKMECPTCSTKLVKEGAHLFCPNPKCPDKVKGTIAFFSSRDQMDIEGLGPKTVDTLYEMGLVKSIEDIYITDFDLLLGKEGFGEKTISNLKRSIQESRKKPFRTLLSSIGIAELGKKNAEVLASSGFNSFSKLIEGARKNDPSVFTSIKMIGAEGARTLIEAFQDEGILELIRFFEKEGFSTDESREEKEDEEEKIFLGETWVVTGSFENFNPRSKALREIEKRGGKTSSSVSSKTTHLLVGKGGGSKRAEAEKLGITLVSEEEFMRLIKESKKNEKEVQGDLFNW